MKFCSVQSSYESATLKYQGFETQRVRLNKLQNRARTLKTVYQFKNAVRVLYYEDLWNRQF